MVICLPLQFYSKQFQNLISPFNHLTKHNKDWNMMENTGNWAISFCGLNCAKCDILQATHGNEKLRSEIIEWFLKERNETLTPEQVKCEGCKGSLTAHWSPDCEILQCAKNKNIQYCSECRDFPCKILTAFASDGISHHKQTVENLKKMKQTGIEAWIAEQTKNGRCTFCP
jgi:hypothetical protein